MGNKIKFTDEEKKYVWAWAVPRLQDAVSDDSLPIKDRKLLKGLIRKFDRLGN